MDPLSGEGAKIYGGRWNLPGIACLYTSSTPELAVLETFVHIGLDGASTRWNIVTLNIPDNMIHTPARRDLPVDWASTPVALGSQEFGSDLFTSENKAAIAVPSIIVPESRNYVLYCSHSDFEQVTVLGQRPYSFDTRMWKNP